MFVKPKKGLTVRDPVTLRPLPESGREVKDTPYWARRLADGDVVRVEQHPPQQEKP